MFKRIIVQPFAQLLQDKTASIWSKEVTDEIKVGMEEMSA